MYTCCSHVTWNECSLSKRLLVFCSPRPCYDTIIPIQKPKSRHYFQSRALASHWKNNCLISAHKLIWKAPKRPSTYKSNSAAHHTTSKTVLFLKVIFVIIGTVHLTYTGGKMSSNNKSLGTDDCSTWCGGICLPTQWHKIFMTTASWVAAECPSLSNDVTVTSLLLLEAIWLATGLPMD